MKKYNVCGIICEYNPFHNGHKFHVSEARRNSEADYVVAVMSGNFVQRGEPAILDKWARTEMALKCGVDMVLELPAVYALSSAEYFATGAVDLLKKTGIITHISFGSESFEGESGALELQKIADETLTGPVVNKDSLREGISFAAASRNSVVAKPNDVLATEYLRAINRLNANMKVLPIRRSGAGHSGEGSAMFIRSLIANKKISEVKNYMPAEAFAILQRELCDGRCPVYSKDFDKIVIADLRRLGVEGLRNRPFVSEGLEYKIYDAACRCSTFEELVAECTSKRYTASRIRRIVFASTLGILRQNVTAPVPYIRVLGMRRNCGALMDLLQHNASVPVILSKAKFLHRQECAEKNIVSELFKIENNTADLYSLAFSDSKSRVGATELTHPLIFV